jgi:hypothetical protein
LSELKKRSKCLLTTNTKIFSVVSEKNTVTLSIIVTSCTRLPLTVTGAAFDGSSRTLTHTHTHIHTEYAGTIFYLTNIFVLPVSSLSLAKQPTQKSPLTRELKWRRGMTNDVGLIYKYTYSYIYTNEMALLKQLSNLFIFYQLSCNNTLMIVAKTTAKCD